ncbi:P-loop NTPase family protein [Planococcus lenghuensis]|uniref:AAA domain-containing protein n=1 Tax=Planococcus lenghuensis TaxID=2213202 RepID=A0A1Q2L4L8_9BACL|nr:hypothetical protein [Planococcus lenghuensis]AQQ55351.1 hypothetical protein B0X71_19455 [Planococcus lenghuensis]
MLNNTVVTFFSSNGNTGLTNTVFSVGQAIAKRTHAKVGVLCLSGLDDSTDYFTDPPAYLDTLKPRLAGKMLGDDADFLSRFKEVEDGQLFILAGNSSRRLDRVYTVSEIGYLIERAKEVFDIVLIDAGSQLDNAQSVQAIYAADFRYAVLTQQPKSIKRYLQLQGDILSALSIKREHVTFILNQYQEKATLMSEKQIAKEVDVPEMFTLPYTDHGVISEIENRILYAYQQPKYQDAVNQLADSIARSVALVFKDMESGKRGIGRLFGKKTG